MARKSYEELTKKIAELQSQIDAFQKAEKKSVLTMYSGKYVSVPLHPEQVKAGRDHYENMTCRQDYVDVQDGERVYNDVVESIFAEFPYVMLKYRTDAETGELVTGIKMFGLVKV